MEAGAFAVLTVMTNLPPAYKTASAEAESAFSDGAVYLEKFLYPAKHVEVQILADKEGNCHLFG